MQRNSKVGPLALPPMGPADEYEATFWQNWRTQLCLVVQKPWLAATWLKQSRSLLQRFNRIYTNLAHQPRPVRRRLQRQLGASLAGAALALALANSPPIQAADFTANDATSLIAAINDANADPDADTITLSGDVMLTAANIDVYNSYTGLPLITSEITIEGAGHTISRDGSTPSFRLLAVSTSGNLTLHQVTLTGGDASDYSGGGLYNKGTVTVSNSTLSANAAYSGGGLYNKGTLTVNNSTLSGNSASSSGGGIANRGTATLNRSLISGNSSSDGAEVYNNGGTVNAANLNLIGHGGNARSSGFTPSGSDIVPSQALAAILNTTLADNGGGTLTHALVTGSPAIDAAGDSGLATDQRGVNRPQGTFDDIGAFELEQAAPGPVNARINGSDCNVSFAIIAANTDTATGDCAAGTAGADTISLLSDITLTSPAGNVYSSDTGLPLVTSEITIEGGGQTISRDASAPDFRLLAVSTSGTLTLQQVTLTGGNTGGDGGGIDNYGTLTVDRSTLSGNAANQGGGIANHGTLTVSNSTLSGNSAIGTGVGGGLFNQGTVTLNNSTLSGNAATSYGGAVYNVSTLTLNRSLISGNTAPDGAEIYNYGGTITAASFNLIGHDSDAGSVGFTPSGSDIVPSQALADILKPLTDNGGPMLTLALVAGGPAIDAASDSGLDTDQRGITRPQGAADDIGAFEALPINVALNGDNCNLGDAIVAANQDRSYGTCAPGLAGGDTITLLGDISLLTSFNNADDLNGLPFITSTITIEGAGFTLARDAAATDPFGLLVVQETGDLTLNNITLTGAYSKYGALASIGQLTVNNSTITGNTGAVLGGGIFNVGTATLNNSSVTNNSIALPYATPFIGGGGIANWVGSLTLNNSVVSSNSSASFAGAINNTKYGTLTVNESTISQNTAAYSGGAIFSYVGAGVSVTSSTISNNESTGYAGGLGGIGTPLMVTNSTISNNQADVGGGFFLVNESSFTMANSTVTGNTGTTSGGGIVTDQAMQLTGNLIAGNISPDGAEILDGSTTTLARRTLKQSSNTLTQKLRAQLAKSPFLQRVQALVEARKAAQSQAQTVQSASPNPVGGSINLFGHSGLTTAEAFNGFTPAGSDLVATSDSTLPTALMAILNTTLADNGGPKAGVANDPILTHALVPGSPAIDAAGDSGLDTDQRAILRPQGTADDIGAVESNDWVNVNSHLTLQSGPTTGFNANPDGTYGTQSPAGVFTINATFRNIADPAVGLRNVYFKVTSINNINSINNYLLNADGAPGQVGSTVSVANSAFGVDSLWSQNEDLPMSFQIGLLERRRFAFFVDVYGMVDVNAAGVGAVQHLGSFQFNLDPTASTVRMIFLPVVVKE